MQISLQLKSTYRHLDKIIGNSFPPFIRVLISFEGLQNVIIEVTFNSLSSGVEMCGVSPQFFL